jgi:hypothetical protein
VFVDVLHRIRLAVHRRELCPQAGVPLENLVAELKLPASTHADTAIKHLIASGILSDVAVVQSAAASPQAK